MQLCAAVCSCVHAALVRKALERAVGSGQEREEVADVEEFSAYQSMGFDASLYESLQTGSVPPSVAVLCFCATC